MATLSDFSDKQIIKATHNSPFLKIFLFMGSVVVIAGFMNSGLSMRIKLRDRKTNNVEKEGQSTEKN